MATLTESPAKAEEMALSQAILERLSEVGTPAGGERTLRYLAERPYPRFEEVEGQPYMFVRIDEDGTRTLGKIVGREFVPV